MRRLVCSTASQSQILLFPAHKSPHLIQFQGFPLLPLRLFGQQSEQRRRGHLRFFYPAGNRHPRDARHAGNDALRVALAQQFVNLRILRHFGYSGGRESGLVPVTLAQVFGMNPSAAIVPNVFTAASGEEVSRKDHLQN